MNSFPHTLVKYRKPVFIIMTVLALLCGVLMLRVPLITDMTRYLPDSSPMKKGVQIMSEEFPGLAAPNTIRVMFTDLPEAERMEVFRELSSIENVDSVSYTAGDPHYEKDPYTLYVLNFSCNYNSPEMKAIEKAVNDAFAPSYELTYSIDDTTGGTVPPGLMLFAVCMIFVILIFMSGSWAEPFLFMSVIGMAILINLGSNLVIGGISDITYSIAAILQMVLSMDYSIILMNRYRQEKPYAASAEDAMEKAIRVSFSSIAGSALTTVVGLLALVFMGFKIGGEMGFVLAKGVLISMICILTMLPALILGCEKLIIRTAKKIPEFPVTGLSRFEYRYSQLILAAFFVLCILMFILKGGADIDFTLSEPNSIDAVFPKVNQIVVLYGNEDENAAAETAQLLLEDEHVESVNAWSTTIGAPLTRSMLASSIPELLYSLGAYLPHEQHAALFSLLEKEGSVQELQSLAEIALQLVYAEKACHDAGSNDPFSGLALSSDELFDLLEDDILSRDLLSELIDPQVIVSLKLFRPLARTMTGGTQMAEDVFCSRLSGISEELTPDMLHILFRLGAAQKIPEDALPAVSISELVSFVSDTLTKESPYASVIPAEARDALSQAEGLIGGVVRQLKGEHYSLMAVSAALPDEGEETYAFMDKLTQMCSEKLSSESFIIGNTPMAYEMSQTFRS
ncbi:MAG: MMPL family transporter, partial [Lachnospiraceae bacterium]|nr:MMPL family transporter [Lachnospiraceae bacterium]